MLVTSIETWRRGRVGVYALKGIALIGKGCKHEGLSSCHVSQNIGDRGVVLFLGAGVKVLTG